MKWIHFRSTLFSGCFVNLCFFSHFLQWGIFLCGQGWTNRNTFTIFHINLLVKTRALLHDLHAWTQNPSPGPAIFRFKSFKQAQVFISSSIFPKHVSLKALGQQRNSAEHKDVFVTTSTRPKADHLQQTLQIASPPGVVPLEPPISASWLSSTDSKNASFSFVTPIFSTFSDMLLRAARDSAVTQIYLNSEVWKCSFTLVISFNKQCIVPSLYILYCSICCYGQ